MVSIEHACPNPSIFCSLVIYGARVTYMTIYLLTTVPQRRHEMVTEPGECASNSSRVLDELLYPSSIEKYAHL